MDNFLNSLTAYSNLILIVLNLILVIITGIYAYLTRRMVLEMKTARENQIDSNLIATPVFADHIYAEVQLVNAGPGTALDIELSISLDPPLQTVVKTWHHPAFLVGQKENFLLPMANHSRRDSLRELAEKHNSVMVNVKWKNTLGHSKSFAESYNLNELVQGWYNAGRLFPPDDLPKQLEETNKALDNIHKEFQKITQEFDKAQIEQLIKASKAKPKASRKKKVIK